VSRQDLKSEETLAGYDRWAKSYDAVDNPLVAATAWVMDRAPLGCEGLDVIELGCGTGRNAFRVLGAGARSYLGVDGSPGMLDVARGRVSDARASFEVVDLGGGWVPERRFDLALVVLVLEHLAELGPLARTLAAALRAGGRARLVDLHADRIARGSVAHFDEGGTEVVFPSVAHPPQAIATALAAAGFEVTLREHLADDVLLAAVPRAAKHRGLPLVIDVVARR
jgi:SAM-dependent methyltransferase